MAFTPEEHQIAQEALEMGKSRFDAWQDIVEHRRKMETNLKGTMDRLNNYSFAEAGQDIKEEFGMETGLGRKLLSRGQGYIDNLKRLYERDDLNWLQKYGLGSLYTSGTQAGAAVDVIESGFMGAGKLLLPEQKERQVGSFFTETIAPHVGNIIGNLETFTQPTVNKLVGSLSDKTKDQIVQLAQDPEAVPSLEAGRDIIEFAAEFAGWKGGTAGLSTVTRQVGKQVAKRSEKQIIKNLESSVQKATDELATIKPKPEVAGGFEGPIRRGIERFTTERREVKALPPVERQAIEAGIPKVELPIVRFANDVERSMARDMLDYTKRTALDGEMNLDPVTSPTGVIGNRFFRDRYIPLLEAKNSVGAEIGRVVKEVLPNQVMPAPRTVTGLSRVMVDLGIEVDDLGKLVFDEAHRSLKKSSSLQELFSEIYEQAETGLTPKQMNALKDSIIVEVGAAKVAIGGPAMQRAEQGLMRVYGRLTEDLNKIADDVNVNLEKLNSEYSELVKWNQEVRSMIGTKKSLDEFDVDELFSEVELERYARNAQKAGRVFGRILNRQSEDYLLLLNQSDNLLRYHRGQTPDSFVNFEKMVRLAELLERRVGSGKTRTFRAETGGMGIGGAVARQIPGGRFAQIGQDIHKFATGLRTTPEEVYIALKNLIDAGEAGFMDITEIAKAFKELGEQGADAFGRLTARIDEMFGDKLRPIARVAAQSDNYDDFTTKLKDAGLSEKVTPDEATQVFDQVAEMKQGVVQELSGTSKKKVGSDIDSLAQEARKYNTAEEFVKAQMSDKKLYIGKSNLLDKKMTSLNVDISTKPLQKVKDYLSGADNSSPWLPTPTLEEIIPKNSELFKAYPQLRDVRVVVDMKLGDSFHAGLGDDIADGIRLSPNRLESIGKPELQQTLRHEIQHLIQRIEGWEGGTTYADKSGRGAYLNHFGEIQARGELHKYDNFDDIIFTKSDSKEAMRKVWQDQIKTKSQLTDIWNKANKGTSKAAPVGTPDPTLRTKREISAKDLSGNKFVVPKDTVIEPLIDGNKINVSVGGKTYSINKNQYQNLKGQSDISEAKPFASELEGLEETVYGSRVSGSFDGKISVETDRGLAYEFQVIKNKDGEFDVWKTSDEAFDEGSVINTFDRKESALDFMRNEADELGTSLAKIGDLKPAKHSEYQLPEGKNYREVLIKAPIKGETARGGTPEEVSRLLGRQMEHENQFYNVTADDASAMVGKDIPMTPTFRSSHWDEPNVISHLRLNERTYKGKKVTFMEELQSDWARKGRDKGFIGDKEPTQKQFGVSFDGREPNIFFNTKDEALQRISEIKKDVPETLTVKEVDRVVRDSYKREGVPNHPLVQGNKWQPVTIKRALQEAVENDSQYFAWINGEQTSARYDLATHVEKADWKTVRGPALPNGQTTVKIKAANDSNLNVDIYVDTKTGVINATSRIGETVNWKGKKLDQVLGKGLADKIMSKEKGTLSGEGLKFGGEWAENLYDKQVKNIVQDLTGGKVVKMDMGLGLGEKADWASSSLGEFGGLVKQKDLKVGLEIHKDGINKYIITEVGKEGKFRAIPKQLLSDGEVNKDSLISSYHNREYQIYDTPQLQQGIKLTPEIKAIIKGEAPVFNTPSKKLNMPNINPEAMPLILLFLGGAGLGLSQQ